ncbi:uncharacterized protein LOC143245790 [Tachypleus tridentatus]|uniref:uncharacterized protein LOC143245790 n=1 Tax=Tachypleus tridentatus TaxID=6853 RepID=UPI003FD357E7
MCCIKRSLKRLSKNNFFITTSSRMTSIVLVTSMLAVGQPGIVFPTQRQAPLNPLNEPGCALVVRSSKRGPNNAGSEGLQYIANFVPNLKSVQRRIPGQICITFDDVTNAVQEARRRVGRPPQEIHELSSDLPKPKHIAAAALIIEEATRILAQRYKLNYDAIVNGLPRIETSTTAVKQVCPTLLKPVKCELSRYRTLTGMCNNLENPSWGSARSAMLRYLPPAYGDGISVPRRAVDGSELPTARAISFIMHHDVSQHDQQLCNVLVAWGQMIDHDLTLASQTLDERRMDIECCKYPPQQRHPNCMPIAIPHDDPFYKFFNKKCMDFARTLPGMRPGCTLAFSECSLNMSKARSPNACLDPNRIHYLNYLELYALSLGFSTEFTTPLLHQTLSVSLRDKHQLFSGIHIILMLQALPSSMVSPHKHPRLSTKSLSTSPKSSPQQRKVRLESRKCRKVYGMDNKDLWCTQCKWKKACIRFVD